MWLGRDRTVWLGRDRTVWLSRDRTVWLGSGRVEADLLPLQEGDVQVPGGGGDEGVEQHRDSAVVVPRGGWPL